MNDTYGSVVRDRMRKSMEIPAKCHCLRCQGRVFPPRPMLPKRSWWERNSEFVGAILWCVTVALMGIGVLLAYGLR